MGTVRAECSDSGMHYTEYAYQGASETNVFYEHEMGPGQCE